MVAQVETGKGTAEKGKAYKLSGGKVRMSKDGDWSESYAINLFDWTLHEQETMPNHTALRLQRAACHLKTESGHEPGLPDDHVEVNRAEAVCELN